MNPTVTIVYRFLPQYRVDFFDRLRVELAARHVNLALVYGKNGSSPRQDEADLSWAVPVPNLQFRLASLTLYWQSLPESTFPSTVVILMQENKLLSNYPLLLRAKMRGCKTAFWGHGLNLQDKATSLANTFKQFYSTRVDWWFAYTSGVAKLVCDMGFPPERVTVVGNAIDTRTLEQYYNAVPAAEVESLRHRLNIGSGPVGIYCGGLYQQKRLPFLLHACRRIRQSIPDFEMIVVGAGPDHNLVEHFSRDNVWVHYVGPKFGLERVPYFKLANVCLLPSAVGLVLLDCFALQCPLVTTCSLGHGPEVEYIVNGRNAIVSDDSVDAFARASIRVLLDVRLREALRDGGRAALTTCNIENMVHNFAEGVQSLLDVTP